MQKNDIIYIVMVIVALLILGGVIVMGMSQTKGDAIIDIISNDTLNNGDLIQFKLIDSDGQGIANEKLKIVIKDKASKRSTYSVTTDGHGNGDLIVTKEPGDYSLNVTFDGNDDYNPTSAEMANLKISQNESYSESGGYDYDSGVGDVQYSYTESSGDYAGYGEY